MYTDQINILNNAKNLCEIYVDFCFNKYNINKSELS